MAAAATILVAVCVLAVLVVDSEDASAIAETVRLRFDGARRESINNIHRLGFSGRQPIREESDRMPVLSDFSHARLEDMGPSQQRAVLAKLAAEKRRLRAMLHRDSRDSRLGDADSSEWSRPVREHQYAESRLPRHELFADETVASRSRVSDDSEGDALVEHSSAMFRAAMKAEVKQQAKDRKRQADIERDEQELEEEQAEAFRVKLHQKEQQNQEQKVRLLRQVERYKRKDRMEQKMIRAAEIEGAKNAAQAARDAAVMVAGRVEKEVLSDVRRALPQQLSQQAVQAPAAAPESMPDHDLVKLQHAAPAATTAQADVQRDPAVLRLMDEISELRKALADKGDKKEPAAAVHDAHEEEHQTPVVTTALAVSDPIDMEADSTDMKAQIIVPVKAHRAPEPKAARVVPQPTQAVAPAPEEPEPNVVDVVPEKPLREPLKVVERTPFTPDPSMEGEENEEEAEYDLIAYAIWGSVGALVVGLLTTVVYCACQQPRDRPWGMPPKRVF